MEIKVQNGCVTITDVSGSTITRINQLTNEKLELAVNGTSAIDKYCELGVPYKYDGTECIVFADGAYLSGRDAAGRELSLHVLYDLDVNSYKYNIVDSVTPTLGGVYPFIRRNGKQRYRSFTLGGLISYHQESEDSEFLAALKNAYEALEGAPGASPENIERIKEKLYRDKVIEFLQDGQVKLFRSEEEGNIFVRLSNVMLTPKKELGRMIYSFSCTATECMEASLDNYVQYDRQYLLPLHTSGDISWSGSVSCTTLLAQGPYYVEYNNVEYQVDEAEVTSGMGAYLGDTCWVILSQDPESNTMSWNFSPMTQANTYSLSIYIKTIKEVSEND